MAGLDTPPGKFPLSGPACPPPSRPGGTLLYNHPVFFSRLSRFTALSFHYLTHVLPHLLLVCWLSHFCVSRWRSVPQCKSLPLPPSVKISGYLSPHHPGPLAHLAHSRGTRLPGGFTWHSWAQATLCSCHVIRNTYLVFILVPGTELLKPWRFPGVRGASFIRNKPLSTLLGYVSMR